MSRRPNCLCLGPEAPVTLYLSFVLLWAALACSGLLILLLGAEKLFRALISKNKKRGRGIEGLSPRELRPLDRKRVQRVGTIKQSKLYFRPSREAHGADLCRPKGKANVSEFWMEGANDG